MKGEKLRALIKFSFPTKLFICSLDQEIKMRYSDALIEELNELERLAKIGEAVEKASKMGTAWVYVESIGECTYPSQEEIQSLVLRHMVCD